MDDRDGKKALDIIYRTVEETGYVFGESEIKNVLDVTERKIAAKEKDRDYFLPLFETELREYVVRKIINGGLEDGRIANP